VRTALEHAGWALLVIVTLAMLYLIYEG